MVTTWLEQWEELHGKMERFGDTSGRLRVVPLFSDVETTQCEEEDGRRRNTETMKDDASYPPPDLKERENVCSR